MITKKDAERIAATLNKGLEQFNDTLSDIQTRLDRLEECTSEYLKKCPFCKSEEISYYGISDKEACYRCDDCLCLGPIGGDEESARKLWNGRG